MSRGRRRAGSAAGLLAGLLLALLASLLGWRLWPAGGIDAVADVARAAASNHTPAAPDDAAAAASGPPAARPAVAPAPPVAAPVEAAAPLPPVDTPLAQVREELEARARRGERQAACRLALDGQFCRNNPLDSQSVAFFEQAIARRGRTTAADVAWIARLEATHARAQRLCADLPPRWAEDHVWRYMLQAARAGDDALAAYFAFAPPIDDQDFLERPEPWQQYRQHAVPLLLAAAARGEVHALWRLQRLHGAGQTLRGMPNAIPPDPRLAAVYAVALQAATRGASRREMQQAARAAQAQFAPDQWQAIEREGRALAQRHFSATAPRDFQDGVFGDLDPQHCEPD